jgi:hypothetical protein
MTSIVRSSTLIVVVLTVIALAVTIAEFLPMPLRA